MWNRLQWGVEFRSGKEKPHLIGSLWAWHDAVTHPDEPTRALLFCTRRYARQWCKETNAKWQQNPSIAHWRVKPVRVRETVRLT